MGGKQKLLIIVFMDASAYAYDLWMPYMRDFNEDDCGYGYLWAMKPNHERSHQRMPCCVTSKQTKLALSRKLLLMIAESPHPQFLLFPVVQGKKSIYAMSSIPKPLLIYDGTHRYQKPRITRGSFPVARIGLSSATPGSGGNPL